MGTDYSPYKIVLAIAVLIAFIIVPTASAHPHGKKGERELQGIPHIHKVWRKVRGWVDAGPPKYDPRPPMECDGSRDGEVVKVYDRKLGAYILWKCVWIDEVGYRWKRMPGIFVAPWSPFWPTITYKTRVIDWHRACPSKVCKRVPVDHYYKTYRSWL